MALAASTASAQHAPTDEHWVAPSEIRPHGAAPGATSRLLATSADGVKEYILVLKDSDEVATALASFADEQHVTNAHFIAIGAVRDPEVGWFDRSRRAYKSMTRREQMEVLSLAGDIALGADGTPVVHAHVVLGASDGSAWGGHLVSAITSPTLEVYVTSFPTAIHKRMDAAAGLQLIDPSIP